MSDDQTSEEESARDFIRNVVRDDLAARDGEAEDEAVPRVLEEAGGPRVRRRA